MRGRRFRPGRDRTDADVQRHGAGPELPEDDGDLRRDARIGNYDPTTRILTLASAQGALGTRAIPGPGSGLRLTGDFALSAASEFAPYGLNILDLRTGQSRTAVNHGIDAEDGDRVAWSTDSGSVIEDLVTGERTLVPNTEDVFVRSIAGDRLLVVKPINTPGAGGTTYEYATYTIDGTKVADLRLPEGYPEIEARAINAQGVTVGLAYTVPDATAGANSLRYSRLVRWSVDGTPTVESSSPLQPCGIADDGTIVGQSPDGLVVRIKDARTQALIGTPAGSTVQLDRTGALFVTSPDGRTLTAYRLP